MKLKEIRLSKGKTQKDMAKELNITQATYSNYESGKTDPDIKMLIKIADTLHTTVDNIVNHNVPYLIDISTFSQRQKEIIDKLKTLSENNCNRVNDFITGLLIAEHDRQETIKKLLGEQ